MAMERKSEESCGNVFADLGVENAEEELAKAKMAHAISRIIKERDLTQTEAAKLLKTDQARISQVVNGRVGAMTYDRLLRFLNALDYTVRFEIVRIADESAAQSRRDHVQPLVAMR
jgi:predicted XRE-type DNA-binding protein